MNNDTVKLGCLCVGDL